jgi:hypothetical protein
MDLKDIPQILYTYRTSGLTTMAQLTNFTSNESFSVKNDTSAAEQALFISSPIMEEKEFPFFYF